MSTLQQIRHAVEVLGSDNILLCHATSTYPPPPEELNLRMIDTLQARVPNVPVGYSGHERGLQTTLAAVALGAVSVERHITLDRTMWGSDQAASLEPQGSSTWSATSASSRRPWATASSGSSPARWPPSRACAASPYKRHPVVTVSSPYRWRHGSS